MLPKTKLEKPNGFLVPSIFMKQASALFLFVVCSISLLGCAGYQSYTDHPLAATPATHEIDIVSLHDVNRTYTVIGEVYGSSMRDLKEQARKLGADAISIPIVQVGMYVSQAIKYK